MQPNYLPDSQKANLSCFFLFDGNMPAEGSEPAVLHTIFIDKKDYGEMRKAPTTSEENSENSHSNNSVKSNPFFIVNQVGLLLTFLKFSTRFSQDAPCDYIRTDKHEIVILELENQVWMSIQRETPLTELSNRNSLHSMLRSCKNIYQLFFNPPKRDPETNLVTPLSINHLKSAFDMIIHSMAWADLGFIHLFESFFQLTPDKAFSFALNPIINEFSSTLPISHMAIMYSRYFIFHTFPTDVARTLSICLRVKLPYLFPRILAKDEERLYWIIGLSVTERNTLSIYPPPLFINGKQYPLIALRKKKLRFLFTLKDNVAPTPELLSSITPHLKPLVKLCDRLKLETKGNRNASPYIVLRNHPLEKNLSLTHEKLSDATIVFAEKTISQAHLFATSYAKKSIICYPGNPAYLGYYVYFKKRQSEESVVMCQSETKEVTTALHVSHELLNSRNVKTQCLLFS